MMSAGFQLPRPWNGDDFADSKQTSKLGVFSSPAETQPVENRSTGRQLGNAAAGLVDGEIRFIPVDG